MPHKQTPKPAMQAKTLRLPHAAIRRTHLTPREIEVVTFIAQGYRSAEIAEHLSINVKTIETHKANIYNKLGIGRIADLVKYAIREKLVSV